MNDQIPKVDCENQMRDLNETTGRSTNDIEKYIKLLEDRIIELEKQNELAKSAVRWLVNS